MVMMVVMMLEYGPLKYYSHVHGHIPHPCSRYTEKACRLGSVVYMCSGCAMCPLLLYVGPHSKHKSPHTGGTPSAANSTISTEQIMTG